MTVSARAWWPWTNSERGSFTFQSGLLVHMLINQHAPELDCYLRVLVPLRLPHDAGRPHTAAHVIAPAASETRLRKPGARSH